MKSAIPLMAAVVLLGLPEISFAGWEWEVTIVDPDGEEILSGSYNGGFSDGNWISHPIGHESVAHKIDCSFNGIQSSGYSQEHKYIKGFHWVNTDPQDIEDGIKAWSIDIGYHAEVSGASYSTQGGGAASNVSSSMGYILGDVVGGNSNTFSYQQGVDDHIYTFFSQSQTTYTFEWSSYSGAWGVRNPTGDYSSWAKSSFNITYVDEVDI